MDIITADQGTADNDVVVPDVEERPVVVKTTVVTGVVRLRTVTHVEPVEIDAPLDTCEVVVERVPVDRWIDAPPAVRQDGDTTIYPVVAEVPVVATRLKLVEEVRVTRRRSVRHAAHALTLRRQEIIVERHPAPPQAAAETTEP